METCNCKASTGICGSITRGTGKLDSNGYWEHPCPHGNDMREGSAMKPEAPRLGTCKTPGQLGAKPHAKRKTCTNWIPVAAQPEPEAARCPECGSILREIRSYIASWGTCENPWHDAAPSESVAPTSHQTFATFNQWMAIEYPEPDRYPNMSWGIVEQAFHAGSVAQPTPPQVDPELDLFKRRLATSESLRTGLIGVIDKQATAISRLTAENQRLTRERDEAMHELGKAVWCDNLVSAILHVQVAMDFLKFGGGEPQGETKS